MQPSRAALDILLELQSSISEGCPPLIEYKSIKEKYHFNKLITELVALGALGNVTMDSPDFQGPGESRTGSWIVTAGPKFNEYVPSPESINLKFKSPVLVIEHDDGRMVIKYEIALGKMGRALLEVVLKNSKSKMKIWDQDEILEEWGEYDNGSISSTPNKIRKPYDAARYVNKMVSLKTGSEINELLIMKNKTIQLNPKYLNS